MSASGNPGFADSAVDWGRLRAGARTALIVQGVLSLIMGVVFLFLPFESVWVLAIFFGAWILVTGIFGVIGHFARDRELRSGWALVSAIASIIAGLLVLVLPGVAAVAVVYVMAFWAIVLGLFTAIGSFRLRSLGAGAWWVGLIAGILAVVLGIMMLINTGAALLGIVWLIGIYAIIEGVSAIVLGVRLRRSAAA